MSCVLMAEQRHDEEAGWGWAVTNGNGRANTRNGISPQFPQQSPFAFALQRIRAVRLKGTCAIILARPVSRTAPGGVHRRGALPLIQPKPRPRVAAFVSPPPRPQPRAAWAGAFPDAPPPWAPLAVPAPVGPPTHRAPQMPGLSRNGAPLPSPTPHVNTSERPPQPPFR